LLTHKTSIAIISKKLPGFKYIQITTGDAPFAGHGKALKAHGKGFAVCRTRQRAHGKQASAKPAFAVCNFSGTRQSLCRVPRVTHGKISRATGRMTWQGSLPCAFPAWHTTKAEYLPCARVFAYGK